MKTTTVDEAESVTRSIARWGSAAAAVIFGVAFFTDDALSWHIVSCNVVAIGLIVAVFAGYALAWTIRYESMGSVIAVVSTIASYAYYVLAVPPPPSVYFLAIGAPALFHLMAILLHRYLLTRRKA